MTKKSSRSKKRFDANSTDEPLEPLTFFVDRCLECRTVVAALRVSGGTVEVHGDHFRADSLDQDWLPEVGKRGWVVLTKDKRIRRRQIEMRALKSAGVRAFVLTSGNMTGKDMADILVKQLGRIETTSRKHAGPFVASVTRTEVKILVQ